MVQNFGYLDLERRLKTLAYGLSSHGVEHGDVVAVMDWDTVVLNAF